MLVSAQTAGRRGKTSVSPKLPSRSRLWSILFEHLHQINSNRIQNFHHDTLNFVVTPLLSIPLTFISEIILKVYLERFCLRGDVAKEHRKYHI